MKPSSPGEAQNRLALRTPEYTLLAKHRTDSVRPPRNDQCTSLLIIKGSDRSSSTAEGHWCLEKTRPCVVLCCTMCPCQIFSHPVRTCTCRLVPQGLCAKISTIAAEMHIATRDASPNPLRPLRHRSALRISVGRDIPGHYAQLGAAISNKTTRRYDARCLCEACPVTLCCVIASCLLFILLFA